MRHHFIDLVSVLFIYAVMFCAYYGWGRLTARLLRFSLNSIPSPFIFVWLGWASSLLLLQVIHIFSPVNIWVSILVFGGGVMLSCPFLFNALKKRGEPQKFQVFPYVVLIACLTFWIGSRSMLPPENIDSGYYHFSSIRWINTYHLIAGLGNLSILLAHNMSFFTYAAVLNFFPYFPHGHALANSFLFVILFSEAAWHVFTCNIYRHWSDSSKNLPFRFLAYLFLLPTLYYVALTSWNFTSPSPDLASTLLQMHIFLVVISAMHELKTTKWPAELSMYMVILSVTAITLKLSNLAFAISMIAICLLYSTRQTSEGDRVFCGIGLSALLALIILGVWMFRGYIISGYPLFPATFAGIPADWAVPIEQVRESALDTYAQSRMPGVHWRHVMGTREWLDPWARIMLRDSIKFGYPIKSSVITITLYVAIFPLAKRRQNCFSFAHFISLLFPLLSGIAFWFFTAPHIRFAHALFWLLSLCSSLVLLTYLHCLLDRRMFVGAVLVVFFIMNNHFISYGASHLYHLKNISLSGFAPVKTVSLVQRKTLSGLAVYQPEKGEQCWDAPIPCSSHLNPHLRLREAGVITSGFTVKN